MGTVAAAIGASIPIASAAGNMVVDIGEHKRGSHHFLGDRGQNSVPRCAKLDAAIYRAYIPERSLAIGDQYSRRDPNVRSAAP